MAMITDGWRVVNDWAASLCGVRPPARTGRLDKTPLDLAAETTKELHPTFSWAYCREYVRALNRQGAMTPGDRLILRRYRDALWAYRTTGEVNR